MLTLLELKKQSEEAFNDNFSVCFNVGVVPDDITKAHIKVFITTQLEIAWREGRKSVFQHLNHESNKMLDGFAHPKDCVICKTLNQ